MRCAQVCTAERTGMRIEAEGGREGWGAGEGFNCRKKATVASDSEARYLDIDFDPQFVSELVSSETPTSRIVLQEHWFELEVRVHRL